MIQVYACVCVSPSPAVQKLPLASVTLQNEYVYYIMKNADPLLSTELESLSVRNGLSSN
jgi:hypothetical protein